MAGNKFQIKRTGIPGRLPNTTDQGNSAFIDVGELAFNFSDGILYSSDGNNAIEIGANVTNQNITGTLTANGTVGSLGQVLTSNGSGIYWGSGVGAEDGLPPGGFDGQALVKLSNTDFDATWVTLTTDQISEGNTNLYFIEAPNDGEQYVRQNQGWVVVNIPPGYDSNNFSDDFALKNTDDLDEGNTNLYFTDQRSIDAIESANSISLNKLSVANIEYPTIDGSNGQVLTTDGNGTLSFQDVAESGLFSVETDDTLEGDGTQQFPLGIAFAIINIGARSSNIISAKLTRLLEVYFRYDDSFREATVFTRAGPIGVIPN